MKKITKIGILSLGLAGCLVAFNASADPVTKATQNVQLVINDGTNTCTASDYNLNTYTASVSDQGITSDHHNVVCNFLESAANSINFQLTDLQNAAGKQILHGQFTGDILSVYTNGTLAAGSTATINFGSPTSVYTKVANTAGTWTGDLQIGGVIPGGTPAGTYTGALYVMLQS